jgi:hypothetical protein
MKAPQLLLLAITLSGAAWITLPGTKPHPAEIAVIEDVSLPTIHTSAVRKTAPAEKAAEAPTLTHAPTPLELSLSAGDVCEAARIMNPMSTSAPMFEAFLNATSPSAELKETFGTDGPLLSTSPAAKKYKSIAAQTVQALRVGGLMDSPNSVAADLATSHAMLLELEKKEPGNAFYPLFRLLVENRLNYSKDAQKETANRISAATTFDSHVAELDREMREAGFINPALLFSLSYFKSSDSVNYYSTISAVRSIDNFDTPGLARLMTEEGLHAQSPSWVGEYEKSRYSSGRMLDEDHYPSISALDKDRSAEPQVYSPGVNAYGPQVCDPGPYERYFLQARDGR